jgi:hypothetical protein
MASSIMIRSINGMCWEKLKVELLP